MSANQVGAPFKIYNCDFGIKINGVTYDFYHVAELTIEDPERNHLTRGANAGNKIGLTYKDGMKEPKRWTIPIIGMDSILQGVMQGAYDNQTRVDVFCIDRSTGSKKMASNAILSNAPQQLTLNDAADSLNVSLEFETFDSGETLK